MKIIESRKISFELNEHDTLQLIALIKREITQTEPAWQSYWENLAQKIKQQFEAAQLGAQEQAGSGSRSFDDKIRLADL